MRRLGGRARLRDDGGWNRWRRFGGREWLHRRAVRMPTLPLLFGVLLVGILAGCGSPAGKQLAPTQYTPSAHALPNFSHIFVIVMENRSYADVIGNSAAPYTNSLAQTYGVATNFYATTHPSLPNYLSLLGGKTFGITSDCTACTVSAPNLVDSLEAGHKTWRAYMEAMPSPCYTGSNSGEYAKKHNPFIYFDDIRTNPSRCAQIVPMTALAGDLSSAAQTPDFVWITPGLCSDGHDCSTQQADTWLSKEVPQILASPAWQQGGVLFLTWDEGTSNNGCCTYATGGHIATLVISPLDKSQVQVSTPYDHYSLLRTITDAWHLKEPGHAADTVTPAMTGFFHS